MPVATRWAIVEVMGHRRYAGQVAEVSVAGAPMLRVFVPEGADSYTEREWSDGYPQRLLRKREVYRKAPAFTVDLGGGALFAVTEVPEATARAAALHCHREDGFSLSVVREGEWQAVTPELPGPVEDADEVDIDGGEE